MECHIDELVFKLYDLTYEEVKVIAPGFWLSEEEYEGVRVE
jgi:adenine-specific DNA-methyltransferase